MQPVSVADLTKNALYELGVYAQGESPSAEDNDFLLSKLARLCDQWNAKQTKIFAEDYLRFTLVSGVQPLLIGEAVQIDSASSDGTTATYIGANSYSEGDLIDIQGVATNLNGSGLAVTSASATQFTTANANVVPTVTPTNGLAVFTGLGFPNYATRGPRPVKIQNANIILNQTTPFVRCTLNIRDADWWMRQPTPTVTTSLPTDLYYNPAFPYGQLFLWPLQDTAYDLELEVWNQLPDKFYPTLKLSMPQGYQDALTYTLAESCGPAFGRPVSMDLQKLATQARSAIQERNAASPTIKTCDDGIPSTGRGKTYFNWQDGMVVTRGRH